MPALDVDGSQLKAEASRLEGMEADRAGHEARVAEIGAGLAEGCKGEAGDAIQKALADYLSASAALRTEEQLMHQKMVTAADAYDSVDDAAASGLRSGMNI